MTKIPVLKAGAGALAAAALGVGIAACGSSSSNANVAPGIATVPGDGLTEAQVTTTATVATPTTPTSGGLSTEPTVTSPGGKPPTKLVVKTLVKGTGTAAADGDDIYVNYYGALYNGKKFQATWTSTNKATPYGPIELGVGEVIKGWDQGLVGVKAGSRVELIIPPSLAYGDKSQSGIPKNSTLIFVIDVLKVAKAAASSSSSATGSAAG